MATMPKTDLEQLRGILDQFSPDVVQEALRAYHVDQEVTSVGAYLRKSVDDFPDPGLEVYAEDEAAVVQFEDLAYIERIIDEPNFLPVHFLEEGAVIQRAVARMQLKESVSGLPAGSGWATGFMVSPSLLLTNNHVIPDKAFASKLQAQFQYQYDYNGNPLATDVYQFDPDNVFYTNAALDFTLIRVKRSCKLVLAPITTLSATDGEIISEAPVVADDITLGPITPIKPGRILWSCKYPGERHGWIQLPTSVSYAVDQHLNVIQHPSGRHKEVALQKNQVTNIYTNFIRYTTDTEPGSSGSPVFNNAWDLLVLHHAGGEFSDGKWKNNEGVRVDKIVNNIRSHFGAGSAVATELGI
ncbi:MAG: serine protease [Anaerolineae bacterium]|nr:serine protease [Anaerolineae bacterium]